jgi:UDP-N-acetylglucosamine transferase subunit ALG13
VTHAGVGSILSARRAGHVPLVVPRRRALGEHVDDHQVRFAAWMADRGQVVLAATEGDLHDALDRACTDPDAFAVAADGGRRAAVSTRFGELVDVLVRYRDRPR